MYNVCAYMCVCMYSCTYVCSYIKQLVMHATQLLSLHSVSIQDGSSTSLPSGQAASIALPPSLFAELMDTSVGIGFTFYETAVLFPLPNDSPDNLTIGSAVIGALVAGESFFDLRDPVTIFLRLSGQVCTLNVCSLVSRSPCLQFNAKCVIRKLEAGRHGTRQ